MAKSAAADAVYDVADLFRQRCLVEGRSLLWPDEEIWSLENIDQIESSAFFRDTNDDPDGLKYWDDISRTLLVPLQKLGADIALMYQLFPSTRGHLKLNDIKYMLDTAPPLIPDPKIWSLVEEAVHHGLGNAGRWYSSGGQQWSAWYYVAFAREVKISGTDVYDRIAMQAVADQVEKSIKYNTVSARNMILHLLFPLDYEPISNQAHKEKIRISFAPKFGIALSDDTDRDLKSIRDGLIHEGQSEAFNFYDGELREFWDRNETTPLETNSHENQEITNASVGSSTTEVPIFTDLVTTTNSNLPFLQEIYDLLIDKKQLIFEGPPGSGKTYVAEKFARWFTGQPLDAKTPLNEQVEIVQFHQSYGYEDFVQGIRPETNERGQLVYKVRDGIFLEICERAIANPEKSFVLIIDEINRGNISRIFGELLLLLEYRGMSVRLPYGSGEQAKLTIPENLYIIGTMNTADRSLAQIDYALRRRFYFVKFMPVVGHDAEVFGNWLTQQDRMSAADRSRLLTMFVNLNEGISTKLNSADLQVGHSYFMTDTIETEAGLNRVWTRAVAPLLNEYLHHHRDRDQILMELTPSVLTRETTILTPDSDVSDDDQPADADLDQ